MLTEKQNKDLAEIFLDLQKRLELNDFTMMMLLRGADDELLKRFQRYAEVRCTWTFQEICGRSGLSAAALRDLTGKKRLAIEPAGIGRSFCSDTGLVIHSSPILSSGAFNVGYERKSFSSDTAWKAAIVRRVKSIKTIDDMKSQPAWYGAYGTNGQRGPNQYWPGGELAPFTGKFVPSHRGGDEKFYRFVERETGAATESNLHFNLGEWDQGCLYCFFQQHNSKRGFCDCMRACDNDYGDYCAYCYGDCTELRYAGYDDDFSYAEDEEVGGISESDANFLRAAAAGKILMRGREPFGADELKYLRQESPFVELLCTMYPEL